MAADSILEVLLKFTGDSSHARGEIEKLTKSQKKEAEEQKKKIEDVRKAWANASNEIVNIGKKIAGAFTATGAAMIAIAKNAANYGDEILTASQKTGESVKNLSQLAYAAKIGETSLDGLVSGMGLLSKKMAEAADGNEAAAKSFNDLGIPIKNADGSLRSATDVMLDFADVAATTKDNTRLTATAMELFGRSGAELIPFLKMGKTGISELMAEADRLGLTLTDKAARAGDAFNDSLTKMNGALQGARNAIGNSLLPILTQYIEKISAWIAANREVIAQKVTEFFQAFISVAKVLVGVIDKLRGAWWLLALAFAGFKIANIIIAFSKLKDAIGGLTKPMQEGISKWAKFGGAATLAATVAIVAINALFDHLNDRLDEASKLEQKIYSINKESLDKQNDITKIYLEDQRKLYKKQGDDEATANAKSLKDWEEKRKEMGVNAETSARALNLKLLFYAAGHKDNLAKIIDGMQKKEKDAAAGTVATTTKTGNIVIAKTKNIAKELLSIQADMFKKTAEDSGRSNEERAAAAQLWLDKQLEILKQEKEEELSELKEGNQATEAEQADLNEKYRLLGEQRRAEHQGILNGIVSDEKKAADERLKAEQEFQKTIADLDQRIADMNLNSLQEIVNNENATKEIRLKAAYEIFKIKMQLAQAELEAQKQTDLAKAKTAEDRARIENDYKQISILTLNNIRDAYKKTFDDLNSDITIFGKNLNEWVAWFTKGANNIQSGLAGIDRLLGTDTGGLQDAVGSAVGAFSSGASAIGSFISGDIVGGISSAISSLASFADMFDALSESTQEGYVKQFEKQGFDDEYSQELLDKMSEVSDAMGDKSFGIKAYIEDFFAETDISNQEEFSRMSDLLHESITEYIAQGHTADEAYEKFGDELEQLTDAQEEYGFETTESLKAMLQIQRQQTKEGRVSGYTDVVKNLENVITGMSAYGFSQESWNSVFGMFQDTFQRLQSEGLSMSEIQAIIGPTMEKAMKIAEEQGLDTSSIEQLKAFYEKMSGAGGLLDVIAGLQGAVSGLADTGSLTQENIGQSATAAMETYQKLLGEGFTQNEALQQMGSLLGAISSSAEQYGYAIPEELANLVTAAEGIGAIQIEKPLDQTLSDGLAEGFDRVVEIMKGFYNDMPAFARGGIIRTTEGDETVARVHEGEYVLAADAVRRMGVNTIDAVNTNGLMPTTYVPVVTENTPAIEQQMQEATRKIETQQAQFMATVGGEIAKSIKEGIAAAMPSAGRTEVSTNVALNGSAILKFLQTAMNNGSLTINANAIRVK